MELFDIVDERGIPTGEVTERSTAHEKGIRHRTAHIWIIRNNNGIIEVLLQQRSLNKDSFPGLYDTSSSGHIVKGDEPKVSAVRELEEELGIRAKEEDLVFAGNFTNQYEREFHNRIFKDNEVAFVYVYNKEVKDIKLQEEEIMDYKWEDIEEVNKKLNPRDPMYCIPAGGFNLIYSWSKSNKNIIIKV